MYPDVGVAVLADVLVLNDFGEWESSVHVEDGLINFRLTLSKSELVAVRPAAV